MTDPWLVKSWLMNLFQSTVDLRSFDVTHVFGGTVDGNAYACGDGVMV